MADLLIYADTLRSPELRHEVPVAIPDPFLYAERNGDRNAVVSSFEIERIKAVALELEVLPPEEFGVDELFAQGPRSRGDRARARAARVPAPRPRGRAVPATFPVELADLLRANGIT